MLYTVRFHPLHFIPFHREKYINIFVENKMLFPELPVLVIDYCSVGVKCGNKYHMLLIRKVILHVIIQLK